MMTDNNSAPEGAADEGAAPTQFAGSFDDFDLPEPLRRGLKDLGYLQPTHVQRAVYAPLTTGRDALVQSRTGSGKTTAFCLPVLRSLDASSKAVQSIALCPTRELAVQVATEAARIGHHAGIKVATIYGGASMRAQIDALQSGAQFVVGTPGRVKDLMRRGQLRLDKVRFAILDEADEMLSMGFWDEVTSILDQLPLERQTMLFSATLPPQIERAAAKYLKDPSRIDLSRDTLNVSTIRHVLHHENDKLSKPRNFLYVLELHKPRSAIVFCNRRDETEMICSYLQRFGFRAEALNGDMTQSSRERTLARVKAGELDMMVATDIAARGIDISDLSHIFNYDLPEFDEVYVHRCGRTGRIGKTGVAVSLVRGKYLTHLSSLKRQYNVPFEEVELPDEKEILWMQAERLALQLIEAADGVEVEQYRPVAESMMERGDVKEILAYLLRQYFSDRRPPSASSGEERRPREAREPRGRRPRFERPEGEAPAAEGAEARPEGEDATLSPARDERPRREPRPPRQPETDAVTLYVTLGRDDGVADLSALIQKLSQLSGVDAGHFTGRGDVRDHSSHIEVDPESADQIAAGVHGKPRGDGPSINMRPNTETTEAPAPSDALPSTQVAITAEGAGAEGGGTAEGAKVEGPRTIVCERARPKARGPRRGPRR